MSTKLFFRGSATQATTHRGTNTANLAGTATGWATALLTTTAGTGLITVTAATVAGPTSGVEVGSPNEWLSGPVSADVTISGAVTANVWAKESGNAANTAINFVVDKVAAIDNAITQIVKSARTTELTTSAAVANFAATPGAGITLNRGDRLRVRVFADDSTTMGSGFTITVDVGGTTAAADGDSYITFTETFSLESAPSGTTLYLTDTASDVDPGAALEREMWTARGAGVVNDVTNTAAGWTAPIQVTDTAGGTVVEWYTKGLTAFTLGGMAKANLRALESNAAANASLRAELAVTANDGTGATVWGSWCLDPSVVSAGELGIAEAAVTAWISGDDTALSDGQRLRLRVYLDDTSVLAMATAQTVTLFYAGTSGGASGDSFLILPQSVTEYVAAATQVPYTNPMPPLIAQ